MRRLVSAAAVALALLVALPAQATITTSTRTVTYTGSGGTTFAVTFPFQRSADLKVTKTTIATSAVVVLVSGVDYTVKVPRIGLTNGVVTTTAAVASTHRITIQRIVPVTQETSLTTQGTYEPALIEAALDKNVMIAQQIVAGAGTDGQTAVDTHVGLADPHVQYALLAGRSGGQTLTGGTAASNSLWLKSTSNATKGKLLFGSAGTELVVDDVNNNVGIGTASPDASYKLDVNGDAVFGDSSRTGLGSGYFYSASDATNASMFLSANKEDLTLGEASTIEMFGPLHSTKPGYLEVSSNVMTFRDAPAVVAGDGTLRMTLSSTALTLGNSINLILDAGEYVQTGVVLGGTGAGDDLTLKSSTNGTKGNIYFGAAQTSGFDEVNSRIGIGVAAPTMALDVAGNGQFTGTVAGLTKIIAGGGSYTVSAPADCGAIITTSTDSAVISLPDAVTANKGCVITVVNTAVSGTALVSFSPDASDGIFGYNFSGTVNKDVRNTKATQILDDQLTLFSDGSTGWHKLGGQIGIWASEP